MLQPPKTLNAPKNDSELLYGELTEVLRQAAYNVHKVLGPGYLEKVYERALAHELDILGVAYQCQSPIEIYYKDVMAGEYIADFLVEDKIILELKSVSELNDNHRAQLMNYLRGTRKRLGVLINFGSGKVQFKRIAL